MHRKLLIGANEGWYTKVHEAVPAVSCRRVYFSEHNYVPGEWPSTKNASTTLVSIRPVPADLLAGLARHPDQGIPAHRAIRL